MKQCCVCGSSFVYKVKNQITCSIQCRKKRIKYRKMCFDSKKKQAFCKKCNSIFVFPNSSKRNYCDKCLFDLRSRNQIGQKNKAFWKGGVAVKNKTEKQLFMCSKIWKETRKKVFERDKFTCQICFKIGGYLNVDHIKPYLFYPELKLELSNLRTLCVFCHRKTETFGCKVHRYEKNS